MLEAFLALMLPVASSRPTAATDYGLFSTNAKLTLQIDEEWTRTTTYLPVRSKTEEKFVGLSNLSEGWDGYDGLPTSLKAIADARAFLALLDESFQEPAITPIPNGDLAFYWRSAGHIAEIEFDGCGMASLLIGSTGDEDKSAQVRKLAIEVDAVREALQQLHSLS